MRDSKTSGALEGCVLKYEGQANVLRLRPEEIEASLVIRPGAKDLFGVEDKSLSFRS